MLQKVKKVLLLFKKISLTFVGIGGLIAFIYLLVTITLAIQNKKLIQDTVYMGIIALLAIFISLPGSLSQFIKEVLGTKAKFKGTMTCPHCGNKVDIEMEEVD